jgi:signal transduction histidine kinase
MTKSEVILLVSENADLRAKTTMELETRHEGLRVTTVSSLDAAWRVVEAASPDVILLEDLSVDSEPDGASSRALRFTNAVSSLATYAPVVVIGAPERRGELSALVSAGAADYVDRSEGCLPLALQHIERRLDHNGSFAGCMRSALPSGGEDFGEVLRHELNNPLTGILGNAELLLAEIRRKNDGRLPSGGQQRVETITALAVRLRETVRRLSQEWESRRAAAR